MMENPVERVFDPQRINRISLWVLPFLVLLFATPYAIIWFKSLDQLQAYLFLPLTDQLRLMLSVLLGYVGGIVLHELIHAVTWALLTKGGFQHIRFGRFGRSGTPYCHLTQPVSSAVYLTGLLMPGVVTGLLPVGLAFWSGSGLWLLWGVLLTQAATGDAIMAYYLWQEPNRHRVQDHPSELGYWVYPAAEA